MATPVEPRPVLTENDHVVPTMERDVIASPIGWSTIFAAAVVAAAVWLVLHLFGVGVGLTAIDTDDASSLRGVGIGTGVWSLIAPIIALFIGGLVAGRVAPTINTVNAVIHGAVVWGLTVLASIIVMTMVVGALVRGAVKVGGTAAEVAGASAGQLGKVSAGDLGLDSKDLVATAIESEMSGLATRGRAVAERAGETALQAAEATGKLVLSISVMMILTLGSAVLGSILAVRRERREHVVLPHAISR